LASQVAGVKCPGRYTPCWCRIPNDSYSEDDRQNIFGNHHVLLVPKI
jgi:hypothetical protein